VNGAANYFTNTFEVKIYPTAKLVATCVAENKMTVASSVANQSYTIGTTAITITPPTFTLTSPTTTTFSNTNFPISYLSKYTKLEYQPSGSTSWFKMPTSPSSATFASTKNDASCFSAIDASTMGFTIYCTDATKFATTAATDYVMTFRYTGQWSKVYDQPTAEQSTVKNDFTLTLVNPCKTDTITMDTTTTSLTVYSGARRDVAAISVTHTPAACATYHTTIIEVGVGATPVWYSYGKEYDDLLTSSNTDTALVIQPNKLVFDAAVNTRKVRITTTHSIFGTS